MKHFTPNELARFITESAMDNRTLEQWRDCQEIDELFRTLYAIPKKPKDGDWIWIQDMRTLRALIKAGQCHNFGTMKNRTPPPEIQGTAQG